MSAETYGDVYSVVGRGRRVDARLDQISSRSGFYPTEGGGFAWLSHSIAEITFLAELHICMRLELKVYCCSIDYPADDIQIRINNTPVKTSVSWDAASWCTIGSSDFFSSSDGRNKLEVVAPLSIPALFLNPGSVDARRLSFAIAGVRFELR